MTNEIAIVYTEIDPIPSHGIQVKPSARHRSLAKSMWALKVGQRQALFVRPGQVRNHMLIP